MIAVRSLTREAEAIMIAVTKFGCVDYNQLKYFFVSPRKISPDGTPYHESIANHLSISKRAVRDGNTLCSRQTKFRSYKMIDSLWAVIYLLKDLSPEDLANMLREEVLKGDGFVTIRMILNKTSIAKFLPCYTIEDVTNILFEQEQYHERVLAAGGKKTLPIEYYIVSRSKEAIEELSKYDLNLPATLLFLQGEEGEVPKIQVGKMHTEK